MATFGDRQSIEAKAAADLSGAQYHIMRHSAAETVNIASDAAAAFSAGPIGVLLNKPKSGEHATVAYLGVAKVVTGAAVTAGLMLTTNGSGRAINAVTGSQQIVIGRALTATSNDGEIADVLLFPAQRLTGAN